MRAYCRECDDVTDASGPWPGRCDACATPVEAHPVRDVVRPGLTVLFVGINPGVLTARVRHHFANPGNAFYRALDESGLTPGRFGPGDEAELLSLGLGITNVVTRATPGSADVTREDVEHGRARLADVVRRVRPVCIAFVGKEAYRMATRTRGPLPHGDAAPFAGARAFVLPSTSGRNAHLSREEKIAWFARLAGRESRARPEVADVSLPAQGDEQAAG